MNAIEKQIELPSPIARVWRALTDHREFGAWFRVKLEQPFSVAEEASGTIAYPGYEHLQWRVVVKAMRIEELFSFTWHPYAVDPARDYSKEKPTLVEFRLAPTTSGTRLTLTESGFENVPQDRRLEALKMNEAGWSQQLKNIETYLARYPD